jgi:DNA-binding transcriptional LysR family regulator
VELRHLRAFVTVAEELSFRRAAQRLRVAQSPLSQHIKRLEREVGVRLLWRTTRQVTLTAAGEAFLAEARRALAAAEAAPGVARRAAEGQIGLIRLGFTGPASYEVLLVMLRAFRRHRPQVRLDTVGPAYSGELADRLVRGDLDAALVRVPIAARTLRLRILTRHRVAAVLPVSHPLAGGAAVHLDELAGEPVIGYPAHRGAATADVITSAFVRHGLLPNVVQEAPDTHTIMLLAGAGVGVGLVPESAGHLNVPGVVVLPVPEIPPVALALAWRGDDQNPALHALVELADEVIDQLPAQPNERSRPGKCSEVTG